MERLSKPLRHIEAPILSARVREWGRALEERLAAEPLSPKREHHLSPASLIDAQLRRMRERFPFVSNGYFMREKLAIWSHKPDA